MRNGVERLMGHTSLILSSVESLSQRRVGAGEISSDGVFPGGTHPFGFREADDIMFVFYKDGTRFDRPLQKILRSCLV